MEKKKNKAKLDIFKFLRKSAESQDKINRKEDKINQNCAIY